MCGFQKILRQKKYFALRDILFNFFHLAPNLNLYKLKFDVFSLINKQKGDFLLKKIAKTIFFVEK